MGERHGIYDTNDPQSYVFPVHQQLAASQVHELWDLQQMAEARRGGEPESHQNTTKDIIRTYHIKLL